MPYKVRLYFQIAFHRKDEKLLELILQELKVGKIYKTNTRPDISELQVSSINEIKVIVEFFECYRGPRSGPFQPRSGGRKLITQKFARR